MELDLKKLKMWDYADLTIKIQNRIVGGIPTNKDLIDGWLRRNMKSATEEERKKLAEATLADLPQLVEEQGEMSATTFKRDETGIFVESRQVKSMLKECANILRELLVKAEAAKGKSRFTNLRARVAERVFVMGDKLHIMRDGKPLKAEDGREEKPIHVMTPQGPRDSIKRFDFVEGPCEFTCRLRYLADGLVTEDLLEFLLQFGGQNGIGSDRSQGNGVFEFTLVPVPDPAFTPKKAKRKLESGESDEAA